MNNIIINIAISSSLLALGSPLAVAGDPSTRLTIKSSSYSVPVSPALATVAAFELSDVALFESTEGLSIEYRLPPEIVGPDGNLIVLAQTTNSPDENLHRLDGPIAEARCGRHPLKPKRVNCMIVYHALQIDAAKTTAFLAEKYQGTSELSARLQVAAAFGNEPAGILSVELE